MRKGDLLDNKYENGSINYGIKRGDGKDFGRARGHQEDGRDHKIKVERYKC